MGIALTKPNTMKNHLKLLGYTVVDKVTGSKGIVTSIAFDLYGCIQALINPGLDKDGKPKDQFWFDIARLEKTSKNPVMDAPNFDFGRQADGKQGAAEKPTSSKI